MTTRETVDARKQPFDAAAALALARSVERIISVKGKSVQTLDSKKDEPDGASVLALLLGPTGNLRAPALVTGRTLVIGFHADVYHDVLATDTPG